MSTESPSAPVRAGAPPEPGPEPVKLGLALSGGGFRATLFHLGVLTRLAELGLLRHLHMISSVSGGSVLAAHYLLLLKHALEKDGSGQLSDRRYRAIVRCIRRQLRRALARDPRNGMIADLRAAARFTNLGQRMAAQYQRFLYASGTKALGLTDPRALQDGPRLFDLRVRTPEIERTDDMTRYNERRGRDCVPQLVLNAATLNTASRFTFTFTEIGDEVLGYVRFDERDLLARYRRVLDAWSPGGDPGRPPGEVLSLLEREAGASSARSEPDVEPFRKRPFVLDHLAWLDIASHDRESLTLHPAKALAPLDDAAGGRGLALRSLGGEERSVAVDTLLENRNCGFRFLEAPFSVLRTAKVSAWYLLHRHTWFAGDRALEHGGLTYAEHHRRVRAAVREVDQDLAKALPEKPEGTSPTSSQLAWYEFMLELYYLRLCRVIRADGVIEVRLPVAVQASANFPPVFGALALDGIFDEKQIRKLQLSDGGLNDNNGIEALFEGRCTHIIASEAGPRPVIKSPVDGNRLGLITQIMVNQLPIVRRLLMRTLREEQRVHDALASRPRTTSCVTDKLEDLAARYPVEKVAFFDMDTSLSAGVDPEVDPKPLPAHPLAQAISQLRTDLDAFNEIEQRALLYQGYQYCDRFVRRYLYKDLAERLDLSAQAPAVRDHWPLPNDEPEWDRVRRVLKAGVAYTRRARAIAGFGRRTCTLAFRLVIVKLLALVVLIEWARIAVLGRLMGDAPWWLMALVGVLLWIPAVLLWLLAGFTLFMTWLRFDAWLAARAALRPERETHG